MKHRTFFRQLLWQRIGYILLGFGLYHFICSIFDLILFPFSIQYLIPLAVSVCCMLFAVKPICDDWDFYDDYLANQAKTCVHCGSHLYFYISSGIPENTFQKCLNKKCSAYGVNFHQLIDLTKIN